jgi:hypothetical protein
VDFHSADDMSDKTLDTERYVPVIRVEGDKSNFLFHGRGSPDRQDGNTGFMYADIQVTNDGGSTNEALQGKVRFEVYNDNNLQDPKAFSHTYNAQDLQEAASESRTDRPVLPLQSPGAGDDQEIVITVEVADAQDGYDIDSSASDIHIPYTKVTP